MTAITASSTPMMTKSSVRPVLRAIGLLRINLIRALQSFRCQFVSPGQNERDRETEQQDDDDHPGAPSSESRKPEKAASLSG